MLFNALPHPPNCLAPKQQWQRCLERSHFSIPSPSVRGNRAAAPRPLRYGITQSVLPRVATWGSLGRGRHEKKDKKITCQWSYRPWCVTSAWCHLDMILSLCPEATLLGIHPVPRCDGRSGERGCCCCPFFVPPHLTASKLHWSLLASAA